MKGLSIVTFKILQQEGWILAVICNTSFPVVSLITLAKHSIDTAAMPSTVVTAAHTNVHIVYGP